MYSFDSRVRYSEVGQDRKLTVTGILNYFQDCSTFQSEDLNLGIGYLEEHHRAWWLSSWQIDIEEYPKLGDKITISTWPYDFKGIYGYRNFMIQDKTGRILVRANSVWFFYDTAAGRPVRVQPEDVRGYGTGEEARLDMEYAGRHIPVPQEYETAPEVTVAAHHIDTNHHVNNAQYAVIAREALKSQAEVRELRIEYKKAAVLGDRIVPRVSRDGDECTVVLCSRQGEIYAVVWMKTGTGKAPAVSDERRPERENR
ncbi:MAG: thioesterase [Eubacteriales bacterium]|nr:thioesterase [Eubacteriales bacterium]